ncbi:hypothetical protein BRARA_J00649 [Brassica rapa]|uniref:RNase H type-1 domain-containing protein n=1 Tax=Brassica campestris TaxID=3711 RepID=A0A397XIW8_BRACM|nr:hypothetical protein BRARA_J00649 [Brassica rapa]
MQVDPHCKRWGLLETALHLLLACPFAAQVWQEIPALFKPSVDSISSLSELLTSNTKMINFPPTGYCCYTDGAWDPVLRISGQGWVVYDPLGVSVRHFSSNRSSVLYPLVAEALAMNAFSGSESLINLLNSSSTTLELQSILFDIRVLCRRFEFTSFYFIPRAGNIFADFLAK